MADTIFAEGFYYDDPHEKAPDFVLGNISVQVAKAVAFLQQHTNEKGYVNLTVKRGKGGKPYVQLDTWRPMPKQEGENPFPDPSGGPIIRKAVETSPMDTDLPF